MATDWTCVDALLVWESELGKPARPGEVSERFKEPVLKTGDSLEPWVRIPSSPPSKWELNVASKGLPSKGWCLHSPCLAVSMRVRSVQQPPTYAGLAQTVEQLPCKQQVRGSIPLSSSMQPRRLLQADTYSTESLTLKTWTVLVRTDGSLFLFLG